MSYCGGCGSSASADALYCGACGRKLGREPASSGRSSSNRLLDLGLDFATLWLQKKVDSILPAIGSEPQAAPQVGELPEEFQTSTSASKEGDATYSETQRTIDFANELRRTETATRMGNMVMGSSQRRWDDIRNSLR
jgi:hypothetical protein